MAVIAAICIGIIVVICLSIGVCVAIYICIVPIDMAQDGDVPAPIIMPEPSFLPDPSFEKRKTRPAGRQGLAKGECGAQTIRSSPSHPIRV